MNLKHLTILNNVYLTAHQEKNVSTFVVIAYMLLWAVGIVLLKYGGRPDCSNFLFNQLQITTGRQLRFGIWFPSVGQVKWNRVLKVLTVLCVRKVQTCPQHFLQWHNGSFCCNFDLSLAANSLVQKAIMLTGENHTAIQTSLYQLETDR